jgi:hypothetical protein
LVALRQCLFDVIKTTPEFLLAKAELRLLEESQNNPIKNNIDGNKKILYNKLNTKSNKEF